MPAYVIAEIDIHDPATYEEYRKRVPATIEKYGGRYLIRGGAVETREGGWRPKRLAVVEFPSMEKARAWYDSPEYTAARAIRERSASGKLIFAEGVR
jgi:uncharacterized protein (DUF1330 family)